MRKDKGREIVKVWHLKLSHWPNKVTRLQSKHVLLFCEMGAITRIHITERDLIWWIVYLGGIQLEYSVHSQRTLLDCRVHFIWSEVSSLCPSSGILHPFVEYSWCLHIWRFHLVCCIKFWGLICSIVLDCARLFNILADCGDHTFRRTDRQQLNWYT